MPEPNLETELERKLEETRDLAARGFQSLSRDLANVQRDVADLRRLLEGMLNWVGRDAVNRQTAVFYGGEPRLTLEIGVRPGSFMSGNEILQKEFACDVVVKNVGTAPAVDFQLEAEFPARFVDISRSKQFFLRKRGDAAVFRVRESNFPNERLLPGRDLRVLTVQYHVTRDLFSELSKDRPYAVFSMSASGRDERLEVPLSELITFTPEEERAFKSRTLRERQASGA
jgi:hypothetical protein